MTSKWTTTLGAATMAGAVAFTGMTQSASADIDKSKLDAAIDTYVSIAKAKFEDSLTTAMKLQSAVDALIAKPSAETMAAARAAWVAARVPYQQTEVYRFGNAIVDDWEGKVNAWPLDEGLIDYVKGDAYGDESDENRYYTANIVANPKIKLSGVEIDATTITKKLLAETLHEVDEVEANVATGYHAVEFLLWGQDLNGNGAGAGDRKASDFDSANCTNGNCDRRADYLKVATDLLVDDLKWMAAQWEKGGEAYASLIDGDKKQSLVALVTGMGSLSYGELAGERMKLGLILHDPEEEHDCFSDNTHYSHYYDAVGIRNVFEGSYTRVDGSKVSGTGLKDLLPSKEAGELGGALNSTVAKMQKMVDRAEAGEAYDQQIGEGNVEGNATVQGAIDALLVQTKAIERAVAVLGLNAISFEGSDSLDNPSAVGQ